ncbi:heme lyase CcmF/NrfE family subunit [Thermoleophilum album]|nr:heme lyase CcmF/NrfE family subunit [Thermoleophilum album]
MAEVGSAALDVALLTALYAVAAALYGAGRGGARFVVSARRAFYCLAGLLTLAMVLLELAYLRSDFSFELVARNSSTSTPTFYKLTAMWSSQEGSLLLWVFLLAVFSSVVLRTTRNALQQILPYATAVLGTIAAFFLTLMVVVGENPFTVLATPPAEGAGLNPLLRNEMMMFHPPALYVGYVGFSIPFAFAVGALITRRTGADWIRATRRFALVAWTFLGAGLLLGSYWGYSELGWGGYWGWDPVENAALMPWLTGTAFLHSIVVQERRGMLRVWNVSLIIATFVLALTGTLLVRSGILQSIHAFGASTLGLPFLIFIVVVVAGSVALVVSRLDHLRSEGKLESLVSREAVFLLNNLALVGLCLAIFWGTFFPLISEAVSGEAVSVGPPWFNRYAAPLAIVLVLLSGIGPALAWRRVTRAGIRRAFTIPVAAAVMTLAGLLALTPAAESAASLLMFTLVAFAITVAAQEFWRGTAARRSIGGIGLASALLGLVAQNRRRYGGYIVHVGMAIMFLGVAVSSAFEERRDARLTPGESTQVGAYTVTYRAATATVLDDPAGTGAPVTLGAVLDVQNGSERFRLEPRRNYYGARSSDPKAPIRSFFEGEATTEVGIRTDLGDDMWVAVQPDVRSLEDAIREADQRFASAPSDVQGLIVAALADRYRGSPGTAQFRLIVFPLVIWVYVGGLIALFGGIVAVWPTSPARRRYTGVRAARLARQPDTPVPAG